MDYTYQQEVKMLARHKALKNAVYFLTNRRDELCCVERDYVRNLHDHFMYLDESSQQEEVKKVDSSYLTQWEQFHDSCIGYKKPADLTVCYLCGPEPKNDFDELISLGVLPQNIWAFEIDDSTYRKALSTYEIGSFPQPKIIKGSIEKFFEQSPKNFDLVYIDACGSIPSSQHALRTISTLCKYCRLISPGIIITNFAQPDITNAKILNQYTKMIAIYSFFKLYPNEKIDIKDNIIVAKGFPELLDKIKLDFSKSYGDFISSILRDIGSIIIPLQRFLDTNYFQQIDDYQSNGTIDINSIHDNSICKYILFLHELQKKNILDEKSRALLKEISIFNGNENRLFKSFEFFYKLKNPFQYKNKQLEQFYDFFEKNNTYQFLDKPTSNLFLDLFINQNSYPLHYIAHKILRVEYVAKNTKMYVDIIPFDDCRYIYEWLPAFHQLSSAFSNPSWQYVFRFAVDGLVKSRFLYNNEFFFQGSVVSNSVNKFKPKEIFDRRSIHELED